MTQVDGKLEAISAGVGLVANNHPHAATDNQGHAARWRVGNRNQCHAARWRVGNRFVQWHSRSLESIRGGRAAEVTVRRWFSGDGVTRLHRLTRKATIQLPAAVRQLRLVTAEMSPISNDGPAYPGPSRGREPLLHANCESCPQYSSQVFP